MPKKKTGGKPRGNSGNSELSMEEILTMLQHLPNMDPAQLMQLQMQSDDPSKIAPFPAGKVQRCLKKVSLVKDFSDLCYDDVYQIQCWCKEDFYMESIFDAGVVPVLLHIIQLCIKYADMRVEKNIKKPITSAQERIMELSLYSIADGLLNENNKKKTDLSETIPLLIDIIFQKGNIRKGFPIRKTAMNYAIKALGESFRATATQNNVPLAESIVDNEPLLETIRAYLRDDRISTPIGMEVSSLLCSLRFVQMLGLTYPPAIQTMEKLGYHDAIKAISCDQPQTNMLKESVLAMFQGRYQPPPEVPTDSIAYHTKKQVKRLCAYCGIEEDPADPHKKCSRCKMRRYCSRECQIAHWKSTHSKECESLKKSS